MKLSLRALPMATHCSPRQAAPAIRTARPRLAPPLALVLAGLAGLAGSPVHAALGENAASVETDRMQVRASVRTVDHPAFTVHELATPAQGLVREYVSPAGIVFAVTWHGPAMPNLSQVLGTHYAELGAARTRQSASHGHLSVSTGNLVFESNGRMRSFHGRAYLSNALPAGVSSHDIE